MANRYFTSLIQGKEAFIQGDDAIHLAKVLRAKPGEQVILCDGNKTDYDAVINKVTAQEVTFDILDSRPNISEPTIDVSVFVGYAKGNDRMHYAIQKSVECGAKEITPFTSEFCMVKPKNEVEKTKRFQRIANEAAKQSGRGILPCVKPPISFNEMIERAVQKSISLFFYEKGGANLIDVVPNVADFSIITGPEGGFSTKEVERAQQAGCLKMGLGPRILRCETAPVVALTALMTLTQNI